jgi:hypothetical protein
MQAPCMEGDAIEIVDVRVLGSMPQTNANVFARNGDRIGFSTMVLPKDFVIVGAANPQAVRIVRHYHQLLGGGILAHRVQSRSENGSERDRKRENRRLTGTCQNASCEQRRSRRGPSEQR